MENTPPNYKYIVYKAFANTFDRELNSWEEVQAFVSRKAAKFNCGIYRYWETGGDHYFDCGPTVYRVTPQKIS